MGMSITVRLCEWLRDVRIAGLGRGYATRPSANERAARDCRAVYGVHLSRPSDRVCEGYRPRKGLTSEREGNMTHYQAQDLQEASLVVRQPAYGREHSGPTVDGYAWKQRVERRW